MINWEKEIELRIISLFILSPVVDCEQSFDKVYFLLKWGKVCVGRVLCRIDIRKLGAVIDVSEWFNRKINCINGIRFVFKVQGQKPSAFMNKTARDQSYNGFKLWHTLQKKVAKLIRHLSHNFSASNHV